MQTIASLPALRRPFSMAGLGRDRLVLGATALAAITIIAAWQWSWLVAIGAVPLLLSVAPCAAMCALGLCMHRMGSSSCRSASTEPLPAPHVLNGSKTHLIRQPTNEV
jgi:hypothetical protein